MGMIFIVAGQRTDQYEKSFRSETKNGRRRKTGKSLCSTDLAGIIFLMQGNDSQWGAQFSRGIFC